MLATIQERLRETPVSEREARLEVAEKLADVAFKLSLSDLELIRRGFEFSPPADSAEGRAAFLAAARALNQTRVMESRARLLEGSIPAATVARGLGVSRQRLHQYRESGRLVAVPGRGPRGCRYPAWQFATDGSIVPGLERVLAAAEEAEMDAMVLHFVMVEPAERLDGAIPAELLTRGEIDRIVWLLRTAGFGPFD